MNDDETLMLAMGEVICLCVYFFVSAINRITNTYKDASGLWKETKYVPLANAIVNLTLNLILVQFWGLYGVLISTVFGFVVMEIPLLLRNLFRTIFNNDGLWPHVWNLAYYTFITSFVCALTYFICLTIHLNNIMTLLVRGGICLVLPNIFFFAAYHKMPEFRQCLVILNFVTKGKVGFLQRYVLAKKVSTSKFAHTNGIFF